MCKTSVKQLYQEMSSNCPKTTTLNLCLSFKSIDTKPRLIYRFFFSVDCLISFIYVYFSQFTQINILLYNVHEI